jgi:hypothetical protein
MGHNECALFYFLIYLSYQKFFVIFCFSKILQNKSIFDKLFFSSLKSKMTIFENKAISIVVNKNAAEKENDNDS